MKKLILFALVVAMAVVACRDEDEQFTYSSRDNIYFGISSLIGLTEDQMKERYPNGVANPTDATYSFAENQKGMDTVFLPVSISGKRVGYERKFKVEQALLTSQKNAEPGLHYAPLAEYYTIPADSGSVNLPVVLYNKDPELEDTTVWMILRLVASEDFNVTVPEHRDASIRFSNRLEQPVWWDNWRGELGSYSRTKHALYIISLGDIEDKNLIPNFNGDNGLLIPYSLFLINTFKALLIDPFLWVKDHPDYVLTQRGDGDYDFYNVNNTFRKYLLRFNDEDGKYYFIDENQKNVSTDF